MTTAALAASLVLGISNAAAQETAARDQQATLAGSQQAAASSSPIMLRGTTGSGEQETVFDESILAAEEAAARERDTSDPVSQLRDAEEIPVPRPRQEQGRTRRLQPASTVVDPLVTTTPSARSNIRQPRSQESTGSVTRDDPFAPLGLRIGSWRAFSTLEQTAGYSSNIDGAAMGDGAAFSRTDASLSLQSDWSRHSARIDAAGTIRQNFDGSDEIVPNGSVSGELTLDLVDGWQTNTRLAYEYDTESATSTAITVPAASRTGFHTATASSSIARTDRKLLFSLRGVAQRTDYNWIDLEDGSTVSQGDRNNTLLTATARAGYEASPAFTPFVEVEGGIRRYDLARDRNGEDRNATILAARGGVGLDFGEKLTGEVSAGYRVEDYADPALVNLEAITIDGNLAWSPHRDTTVTLSASTGFSGATTAGDNGSVVRSANIGIERRANDRLTLAANGGVQHTAPDNGDPAQTLWTAGAGFSYWLNRFMAITGSVEHTNQQSESPALTYDATSVRAGIRLQR
ncbi:MAG: outer membrane beta-barrel protein [Phyllobacteriaceae bacterium]|nr:outer membrane beta-barrel protein [Phyllobacteriaceae bacterium]